MLTTLSIFATVATGQAAPAPVTRVRSFDNIKAIAIAAAPSGTRFAIAQDNSTVRIMDPANTNAAPIQMVGHPQPVYAIAWNASGTQVVTGDETARIFVWDARTGRKLREFPRNSQTHNRGIQSLAFSPDGRTLISTSKDDSVILWDFATATPQRKIGGNGVVFASAVMPRSGVLLMGTLTEGLHTRRLPAMTLTASKSAHGGLGIQDLAISKAGTRAISGGKDGRASFWDTTKGTILTTFPAHGDSVQRVAISADGRVAASSANDRVVFVYDLNKRTVMGRLNDQCAVGAPLAFSADGRWLLSVTVNDTLQVNRVALPAAPATKPTRRRR